MRIDFTPDPGLFPFGSRFYESSAGRVHYIDEGSGIPLLLLHGNPTWSFLYRKIVTRLEDSFRCIAVDYPGFGLSDHPDGYGYTPEEHAMARSMVKKLSQAEMDHYRKVQPTPEARAGVAEFPRQILEAEPMLSRLNATSRGRSEPSRWSSYGE